VARIFTALENLRDDSKEAKIAAYKARIEICREEKRDPAHIRAMEEIVAALERGIDYDQIDPVKLAYADVSDDTVCSMSKPLDVFDSQSPDDQGQSDNELPGDTGGADDRDFEGLLGHEDADTEHSDPDVWDE